MRRAGTDTPALLLCFIPLVILVLANFQELRKAEVQLLRSYLLACRRIAMGSAHGLRTITGHSNNQLKEG
jgi:hypothetical protein